jgi:WhiB family redox-sensing transcriptional regulator
VSDVYDGLLGALAGIPRLDGCACRSRHRLFESDDPSDIADAVAICGRCPALDACSRWYDSLPPRHRMHGVTVAGQWRPAPRQKKQEDVA